MDSSNFTSDISQSRYYSSQIIVENSRLSFWRRIKLILSIIGPGIITSNVDNDAGGIATYSLAGAEFGLNLLWTLAPITILLIIIQNMSARMGIFTGKGLSALIRERFGAAVTFYLMISLVLTNIGNTVAEFAGVAAALEIFGISRILSVSSAAILVWFLVIRAPYKMLERIFLIACMVYLAYPISGLLARPDWSYVWSVVLRPNLNMSPAALTMVVAMIGTTVAPWMQFYLQAALVDKGLTFKDYNVVRLDIITGSITVSIVAFFIILVCATTLNTNGIQIESGKEAAMALVPLSSEYAIYLFAFSLLNASLFSASILPLSTAYTVCEAFGWESSVNRKLDEAPQFYILYSVMIVLGAVVVMLSGIPLIGLMYFSQVINGIVLPIILAFIAILNRDRKVMGEQVVGIVSNIINWFLVILLSIVPLYSLYMAINILH